MGGEGHLGQENGDLKAHFERCRKEAYSILDQIGNIFNHTTKEELEVAEGAWIVFGDTLNNVLNVDLPSGYHRNKRFYFKS